MIFGRAGLGRNLDASATRTAVFGRVGIVIDGHCLDRRRREDAGTLHAIDNQRDAVRSERAAVQKARHRGDDVLIENRQIV